MTYDEVAAEALAVDRMSGFARAMNMLAPRDFRPKS